MRRSSLSGALFTPEQLANGFVTSVVLLVGLGTLIHSMLDYSISILIWKPVSLAVPRSHEGVSASKSKALTYSGECVRAFTVS